jgi:beta-glucosidase
VCTDWGIIEGFGFLGIEMFEPTSWGVSDLSVKERIKKVIDAGVDQFGGNSNTEELLELVKEGNIREERIDQSVRRLLKVKFELGLFDDPYIDAGKAGQVVGKPEFVEKGQWAQRKSIVLLKNSRNSDSSHTLPLDKNLKIYVEHFDKKIAGQYATVVDSLEDADVALLHLETPWQPRSGNFIETMFHQGDLDFKSPELERLLSIMNEKPAIVCLYLDRAAVIPEVAETARGLLADFGADDSAVLDVVFGKFNPRGKLPIELPSSMEAVRSQMEDVPFDTKDPLFPFGFGLSY